MRMLRLVIARFYADNGAKIPTVGVIRIFVEVKGKRVSTNVYVNEAVDDFIFGFDWLRSHNCEWLFSSRRTVVDGTSFLCVHAKLVLPSVAPIFMNLLSFRHIIVLLLRCD